MSSHNEIDWEGFEHFQDHPETVDPLATQAQVNSANKNSVSLPITKKETSKITLKFNQKQQEPPSVKKQKVISKP